MTNNAIAVGDLIKCDLKQYGTTGFYAYRAINNNSLDANRSEPASCRVYSIDSLAIVLSKPTIDFQIHMKVLLVSTQRIYQLSCYPYEIEKVKCANA